MALFQPLNLLVEVSEWGCLNQTTQQPMIIIQRLVINAAQEGNKLLSKPVKRYSI